jgi:hypothetical protein
MTRSPMRTSRHTPDETLVLFIVDEGKSHIASAEAV